MRSTGEVAALDAHRSGAYIKSLIAAGLQLPPRGATAWLSLPEQRRPHLIHAAHQLHSFGWKIACLQGDADAVRTDGLVPIVVDLEGLPSGSISHAFEDNDIKIVFELAGSDANYVLRRTSIDFDIPLITNVGQFVMLAQALVDEKTKLLSERMSDSSVLSMQDHLKESARASSRVSTSSRTEL